MMASSIKRPLIYSLFFVFCLAALNGADVKLRIYLNDGSLQSGNLITKTEKSFVILGKEGRQEIPFEEIMFINGKTLQEWEKKPDQLFQTEIIPSELPEVGFVNDKAALPKPPPLPSVSAELPKAEPVQKKPEPRPEPRRLPLPEKKVVEERKEEPAPAVRKEPELPAKTVQDKPKEKPEVKQAAKKLEAPRVDKFKKQPEQKVVRRNKNFNRGRMGDVHYQNAKELLADHQRGAAVQELHFATMLDRRNADAAFMLGKIYFDKGIFGRAKKMFEHPGLKKNDEAARLSALADEIEAENQKARNIFLGATAGGLFLIVPGLLAIRRFGPKPVKKRVYEADQLAEAADEKPAEPAVPPQIADVLSKMENAKEAPSEEEPARMDSEAPAVVEKPLPPPPPPVKEAPRAPEPPPVKWPSFKPPAIPKKPSVPPPPPMGAPPSKLPAPPPIAKPTPPPVPLAPPPPPKPQRVFEVVSAQSDVSEPSGRTPEEERDFQIRNQDRVLETLQGAHASAGEGNWGEAEKHYRTVLLLDPANVEAVLGLGFVYFGQGLVEPARNFYVQALRVQPENVEGLYGLGQIELARGKEEEAVDLLQKVLSLDPTFKEAEETLQSLGRLPGASNPEKSDLDRKIS